MVFLTRLLMLWVVAFPALAVGDEPLSTWEVLPEKSSILFTAYQNNVPVQGSFQQFKAVVFFDPEHLEQSSVQATISLASVQTAYSDVADNLKKEPWFHVERFPSAVFKSRLFTHQGGDQYMARGTLTLRGVKKSIFLPFTFTMTQEEGIPTAVVEGKTTIMRSDFGVGQGEWADTGMVADKVDITLRIIAHKP